ncbi:hypothetical protein GQ53DRAFT_746573 [Thozetella sp. PMI_491]|nr:hypothetical protein GQ53DRAFT_746573 [Thozetella sp. PMI_491]
MASNGISRFYAGVLRGGEVDRSLVRSQRIEWNISQFYMTAIYISTMASASQWTLVQDLYPRLLDHVEPLLQERNPIVAVCLLQICARFYQAGQSPVLNRFLAFVKAITSARGSETHPLRLLASAWLQGGEKDSALDLIARGSQQAYDIVSKQLGPEHPQTLSVSRALHSVYSAQRNWTAALSVIESTVNTEAKLNLDDLMTVDARLRMVRSMIALDNLQGAADILDAQESSVRRMTESGQINSIQAKRLLNPLQSNRAEMLRRQLDPRAEAVAEELMSEQTISSDTHELSVTIQLHRHLQLIRATLKTGVIEPYDSPC